MLLPAHDGDRRWEPRNRQNVDREDRPRDGRQAAVPRNVWEYRSRTGGRRKDEAFLQRRRLNDLKPNELFSVSLRVLVHHDEILIATSNRAGTSDDAFKPRMQLALHYEKLGRGQRSELAEYASNGREIRNSITTARKLAQFKGRNTNCTHLKQSLKIHGKFDKY
ncbi:hypothetical protein DL768_002491 [Monosporascus sp. mg162]|nr:hypothetical protein DL768_002491 [Monosporascus sp. mg162]